MLTFSSMKRVLLLNADAVQSISISRSFKRQGWKVVCFCISRCSSGYVSRYVDERVLCPDLKINSLEFDVFLKQYLSNNKIDLIIPMIDDGAVYLSQHKEQLERGYNLICAIESPKTLDRAIDKKKLMDLCKQHNIPHPKTIGLIDNIIIEDNFNFPALIKPNISAGARGITYVESIEDVYIKSREIRDRYGECTLQEFVIQPDYYYNVMMYRSRNGKILADTIIKIRRYFPINGGTSCYCETVEIPHLKEQCSKVLDILDWHGFADFDVLEDRRTSELKIIEINPRVPSSLQGADAAGVDFGLVYKTDLFGGTLPEFNYKEGQQIRWFGLDVMWFIFSPKRFCFKPSWFKFFGKDVSYQDGSFSNPLPMLVGCLAGVIMYLHPKVWKAKFGMMRK